MWMAKMSSRNMLLSGVMLFRDFSIHCSLLQWHSVGSRQSAISTNQKPVFWASDQSDVSIVQEWHSQVQGWHISAPADWIILIVVFKLKCQGLPYQVWFRSKSIVKILLCVMTTIWHETKWLHHLWKAGIKTNERSIIGQLVDVGVEYVSGLEEDVKDDTKQS